MYPDVDIWTESWLTPNHLNNEYFPKSLGYVPYREDRAADSNGEGALIATEQNQFKTGCEIVWVKLNVERARPLYIAVYYCSREGDVQKAEEYAKSLALASKM